MTTTFRNKTLIRRFYNDVFNNRELHVIDELVSADFVDHNPEPGQAAGVEGVKAMFRGWIEAFPDLHLSVNSLVAEGDLVCAHCEITGTHLGPYLGTEPTGRTVRVTGFDWARIDNGLVAERWGVFDGAAMMQQLGLAPSPSLDYLKKGSARYYEILDGAKGDLATIRAELLHPQAATYFGSNPQPLYPDALQGLLSVFWTACDGLTHTIEAQVAEGDTVYNRMHITAKHVGELFGVPATNKDVKIDAMTLQRWDQGRIVEQRIEVDFVSLLVQLGAIEVPK